MKKTYIAGIVLTVLVALTGWISVFNPGFPSRQINERAQPSSTVFAEEGVKDVFFELYAQDAAGKRTCLNDTLQISYTASSTEGLLDTLMYPDGTFTIQADLPEGVSIDDLYFAIKAQPAGNSAMVQVFSQEGYIQLKRFLMAFGVPYPDPIMSVLNQNMSQTNSGYHTQYPTREQSDDPVSDNHNGRFFLIGFNEEGRLNCIYRVDFYVSQKDSSQS